LTPLEFHSNKNVTGLVIYKIDGLANIYTRLKWKRGKLDLKRKKIKKVMKNRRQDIILCVKKEKMIMLKALDFLKWHGDFWWIEQNNLGWLRQLWDFQRWHPIYIWKKGIIALVSLKVSLNKTNIASNFERTLVYPQVNIVSTLVSKTHPSS